MELVEFKNGPRIGRPPTDGMGCPWKDPGSVSQQEPGNREIPADGHQAIRSGKVRVGKPESVAEDGRRGDHSFCWDSASSLAP